MQPNAQLVILPNTDHVFGATHPWMENELSLDLQELCKQAINFLK